MITRSLALCLASVFVMAACDDSSDQADRLGEISFSSSNDEADRNVRSGHARALWRPAGTVIHLNRWRWHDIMVHIEDIRNAGYSAILISPHTATCGGEWSDGYDPYDLNNFHSRFGTEHELYWLVRTAHHYGIQVYADMIFNHMCARDSYNYPRFSYNDFHHNGHITDWNCSYQLKYHDLLGLHDLRQDSEHVRAELWNYLVKTNNLGIDGYRLDAARHVPLWYWRDHIVNNVNSWGKLAFGEVFSGNLEELQRYADAGMSVTDFNLYFALHENFRYGGNLAALDGAGYAARDGFRAMTFVENHDVAPPPNRLLAYAFVAAYPGYPTFYNVSLHDQAINNLVWIRENKAHGRYINRHKEQDVIIFERDHQLLAAINQSNEWQTRWVETTWRNTRLQDYTFNTDFDRWVNEHGWVEVAIPPMSYVMLAP